MREEAVLLGHTRSLIGILTEPPAPAPGKPLPAMVLLNAGLIHRIGPHRLYVQMARILAAMGFVVLRLDFSGIGDSEVRSDTLPFAKSALNETQEAMNWLQTARGSEQFVLMGICSGANAAFRTACHDARVVGAVLINARGHLHQTSGAPDMALSRSSPARHYWRIAFRSSFKMKIWRRALTGKVDYRRFLSAMRGIRLGSLFLPQRHVVPGNLDGLANIRLLTARGVRLLHIFSEEGGGLDDLHVMCSKEQLHELQTCEQLGLEIIPGANHIFTLLCHQEYLLHLLHR